MSDNKSEELRKAASEIIASDDVKYVIGYDRGSYSSRTKPALFYTADDTENLIWSPLCVNNLAVFLKHAEKLPVPRGQEPDTRKIGVVVKGCDVRALNQLMQELTIERDDVVIIGMACEKCIDPELKHPVNENGKFENWFQGKSRTWYYGHVDLSLKRVNELD